MIGPSLPPRSQAAYDRTSQWAKCYYNNWAARVRAERTSSELAGTIPDDLMNDLSDSEDEKTMAVYRHVPTPPSMPSSPLFATILKSLPSSVSIHTGEMERKHDWRRSMYSPVDTDSDLSDSARWQSTSRPSTHRALSRRSSDLIEQAPSSSGSTRSRASVKSPFLQRTPSGSRDATSKKHMRKIPSRRQTRPSLARKRSDSNLRQVRHGKIAKRPAFHRDLN